MRRCGHGRGIPAPGGFRHGDCLFRWRTSEDMVMRARAEQLAITLLTLTDNQRRIILLTLLTFAVMC